MPTKNAYLDFTVEWLAPLGSITARAMMGGHILYCDCTVFALIANNTLYLKADDATRPRFEALRLKAFQPFPDKGGMSYYQPPAEFFEDESAMLEWGRAAVGAGLRAKKKPAAKRKKRR
jgi:DNA transformation protein